MNCPSRTDNTDCDPGWNQSPPFLAADLTTCEDLNGIVNSRELERSSGTGDHLLDDIDDDKRFARPCSEPIWDPKSYAGVGAIPSRLLQGARLSTGAALDQEYQGSFSSVGHQSPSSTIKSWGWWTVSVFCTSVLLTNINVFHISNTTSILETFFETTRASKVSQSSVRLTKRSMCQNGGVNGDDYNTPFHVGTLFIVFFVSTTSCAFPMLALKFPRLRIPTSFLFSARHFGTGVLIATAFVHLLPTAFISLGNPCLSDFWTTDYPAMPGAIVLAGIFFLAIIEMVFSPAQRICGRNHESVVTGAQAPQEHHQDSASTGTENDGTHPASIDGSLPVRNHGPLYGRSRSISRTLSQMGEENDRLDQIKLVRGAVKPKSNDILEDAERNQDPFTLTPEQVHKKAVMQCVLLEIGILFHSVFIGMSLSVSVGSEFVILLIAIIFHQTFEGLALGARIASLTWPKNAVQPWLMAFTYGCTTPIGQAIGIATHTLYSPDSEVGLLMVGIMNAISSGLLVFASLVELMSEDFLSDKSWQVLRGKRRVYACILVFAGAFSMSLVGAWA